MPFLVIDDFGVQRNTEWEMEMLYNLIDSRYTREKPTFITSNISIEEFKLGTSVKSDDKSRDDDKTVNVSRDRICSRIKELCKIISFDLPDYRNKFKQEINF